MTTQPDYYAALRLNPAATQQEISRAYRALMRTHHPDVDAGTAAGADTGTAADRITRDAELLRIMQAFAVLRDPVRRAAYDSTLAGGAASEGRAASAGGAATAGPPREGGAAIDIPVRKVHTRAAPAGTTIRIMPVRWESGPWI
ncbi:DnaJ domain-containing protein [Pseudarthrobacter sp. YALA5]|uniref:J domain-containing protein n=1 Tax=Pseudarthrobacter sp. DSP2-3-2b1 TaxID=2804661 RepID=UPI00103F1D6C